MSVYNLNSVLRCCVRAVLIPQIPQREREQEQAQTQIVLPSFVSLFHLEGGLARPNRNKDAEPFSAY